MLLGELPWVCTCPRSPSNLWLWGCLQGLQEHGSHCRCSMACSFLDRYMAAKHAGKWGPRGDIPGISLLAQGVSEPSSAWLLSFCSDSSPRQRFCSTPLLS